MNEERDEYCLRQVEHIYGHLWHRYSLTINHGGYREAFEVKTST